MIDVMKRHHYKTAFFSGLFFILILLIDVQAAMKTSFVLEFLLSIFIFVEKIDYINGCGPGQYRSEDIPGCVSCPVSGSCEDQHWADVTRCKEACETKTTTTARPTLPRVKTKVPKHDQTGQPTSTTNPPRSEVKSTGKRFKIPAKIFAKNNTTPTAEEADDPSANSENLPICIAVLGTFIVFLIVAVIFLWRRSSTSIVNEKSGEEERIEICGEPSTSSREPSPVVKRSRSESSDNEEINCRPSVPETETGNLLSAAAERESKLMLKEEET